MWDLIIKATTAVIALGAFWFTASKYFYEKNRQMYERRLNEVYAPLYALLAKQEVLRRLYIRHVTIDQAPILTSNKDDDTPALWDRNKFIQVLNETRMGLARPKLLRLISEYEALVYIEENFQADKEKWQIATKEKVKVENELFDEIVNGYIDMIIKLDIDDKSTVIDIYKFRQ